MINGVQTIKYDHRHRYNTTRYNTEKFLVFNLVRKYDGITIIEQDTINGTQIKFTIPYLPRSVGHRAERTRERDANSCWNTQMLLWSIIFNAQQRKRLTVSVIITI